MTDENKTTEAEYPKPDLTDLSNFTPQVGYALIRQWTEDDVTAGGIIIPDAKSKPLSVGWVIVAGAKDTAEGDCLALVEGDTVLFCNYSPTALPELGDRLLMVRIRDILGTSKFVMKEIEPQ